MTSTESDRSDNERESSDDESGGETKVMTMK